MCLADEILINPNLPEMVNYFKDNNLSCCCGVIIDASDNSGKPIAYNVNDNQIISVEEKPSNGYPNAIRGIGEVIFSKESLDFLSILEPNPKRGELEMGDWIQMIADKTNKAHIYPIADAYVNINYAKDIEDANSLLMGKKVK